MRVDLGVEHSQKPSQGDLFADTLSKFLRPEEIAALATTNRQFKGMVQPALSSLQKKIADEAEDIINEIKARLGQVPSQGKPPFLITEEYKLEHMKIPRRKYRLALAVRLGRHYSRGQELVRSTFTLKILGGAATWEKHPDGEKKKGYAFKDIPKQDRMNTGILITEEIASVAPEEVAGKIRQILNLDIYKRLLPHRNNLHETYSVKHGWFKEPMAMSVDTFKEKYDGDGEEE